MLDKRIFVAGYLTCADGAHTSNKHFMNFTFRVGDCGKTRSGGDYQVKFISELQYTYKIRASITSVGDELDDEGFALDGRYIEGRDCHFDLMPPTHNTDGTKYVYHGGVQFEARDVHVSFENGIKFKVGDRVRVLWVENGDESDVGAIGTVKEDSRVPWIHFDQPTKRTTGVQWLGIPDGYADCLTQDQLELVTDAPKSEDVETIKFKVGDTGVTRGGMNYEVKGIVPDVRYPVGAELSDGSFNAYSPEGFNVISEPDHLCDLMPPTCNVNDVPSVGGFPFYLDGIRSAQNVDLAGVVDETDDETISTEPSYEERLRDKVAIQLLHLSYLYAEDDLQESSIMDRVFNSADEFMAARIRRYGK